MSEQSTTTERVHPLHWFTGRLHEKLDEIGSPALWSMNATEMTQTLTELASAASRMQGLSPDGAGRRRPDRPGQRHRGDHHRRAWSAP